MKKTLILILTLFLTPIIAGLYGIIHDQFTYSISHEYFTKFKFIQFGLYNQEQGERLLNPRQAVAAVGFMATWWTGIIIGLGLGLSGLLYKDYKKMIKEVGKGIIITLVATVLTGLVGLAYGKLYLSKVGVDWWLPNNLIDKESFITVGSMHNFSYLGGALGLGLAITFQIIQRAK